MIDFERVAPVKLKGVGDGFWITLDPSYPEDLLKSEIKKLFERLSHLAVNANVVIDVGDAKGQDQLVVNISTYLKTKFDVGKVSIPSKKRSSPLERIRQRDLSKSWKHHKSDVLMLRGRVRSGQKIHAKKHIVIAGDVNPGSEICGGGDVIVLGKLAGKVHAGMPDRKDAIIFALEFKPTLLKIGTLSAVGVEGDSNPKPLFASIEEGKIVVKDYMKANPFKRIPWPEAI
ncbi:MAG: septum site-determining protein MinC [Desulfobacteraceae bacterium]|nr:septum site-determining protein MinC [Desulfobacteraceae bacterium]